MSHSNPAPEPVEDEQEDPNDRWECSTCGARYRTRHEVSSCESNHEYDYGPDQDWPGEN